MTPTFAFVVISQASVLLPLTAGLVMYKRADLTFQILCCFFFFSLLTEIGADVMGSYYRNNMPLLHFFTVMEFVTFAYVFRRYFADVKSFRMLIAMLMAAFLLVSATDATLLAGVWKFNTTARAVESLLLVILCLCYYYWFFRSTNDRIAWKQPMFWFTTAVLVYFSLDQFFFMLVNHLATNSPSVQVAGILMHGAINIVANILFAISFTCFRGQTTV